VAGAENLGRDDAHDVQQQEDAAGDDGCPEEAAPVFPEFALHEPVHVFPDRGFHA
jgi:hypothetical protein